MPKRCPRRSSSPCPGLPYFSDCGWRATGTAAVFSTMRIARYLGAGGPGNMQHVRHRRSAFRRGLAPARSPRLASTRAALSLPHLRSADRKSLLLGTALASTLLLVVCSHLRRLTLSIALLRPRRLRGHPVRLLSFRQSTTLSPAPTPTVQQSGFTAAGRRDSSVHIGDQHYIDLNNSGERRYRRRRHLCAYPGQREPSQRSQ